MVKKRPSIAFRFSAVASANYNLRESRMMTVSDKVRVVIADDERPARYFLASVVRKFDDVELVGEAANGMEAVALIESARPDLALLDLKMPELDGFGVVRLLRKDRTPLIAFVTAHDEHAIRAFDVNAVDYILKPVEATRLRRTINRVKERLEREDHGSQEIERIRVAAAEYEVREGNKPLHRIPVRRRDEIVLVPVSHIVSIVADRELLYLHTTENESHTICYRLRDLAARLDPTRFVRLGRGTVVNVDMIRRIIPVPGGTYTVVLKDNQEFPASRIQSKVLRDQLLRL